MEVSRGQLVGRLDASDLRAGDRHPAGGARRRGGRAARAGRGVAPAGDRGGEGGRLRARGPTPTGSRRITAGTRSCFRREIIARQAYEAAAAHGVAQAKVREAEERLGWSRRGQEGDDRPGGARVQAEAGLELAKTRLSYAEVVSPLRGMVLSKNMEPGDYVAAGTPIVTVGDLDNVWLRGYVEETDLGRVKVGQAAAVTTDSFPGSGTRGGSPSSPRGRVHPEERPDAQGAREARLPDQDRRAEPRPGAQARHARGRRDNGPLRQSGTVAEAIRTEGLRRVFGGAVAVDGLTLSVERRGDLRPGGARRRRQDHRPCAC